MKILFCGKGGSGKSTISALTARALSRMGYRVLLVDADETNTGLHRFVGATLPVHLLQSLGGKKGFQEQMKSTFPGQGSIDMFNRPMKIEEIPDDCVSTVDGIRLLVIGKIHDFGEGCACPMGSLSKLVLSGLALDEKDVVIIDSPAGVEHFGRGIDGKCDLILGIVDPTFESLGLVERIDKMAGEAGAECRFVLNKVDDRIDAILSERIDPEKIITRIPDSPALFMAGLEGRPLTDPLPEIEPICRFVERTSTGGE